MKHLKQAEQKCSDTAVYRYIVGFTLATANVLKKSLLLTLKYSTEIVMVVALIGIIIAGNAFDSNVIEIRVCFLFIAILMALIVALIKIKILESKRGDK